MGFNSCWIFMIVLRSNAAETVTLLLPCPSQLAPCHACPQASTASIRTHSELIWVQSSLDLVSSNLNSLIWLVVWSHQCLCWRKGRCIERKGMNRQGKMPLPAIVLGHVILNYTQPPGFSCKACTQILVGHLGFNVHRETHLS